MQKTITKEPEGPVARARALGVSGREYFALGRLATARKRSGLNGAAEAAARRRMLHENNWQAADYELMVDGTR